MAEPKPEQVELLQQEQPKQLKIQVKRVGSETVFPTTGALGSVNSDGASISVHLYYEQATLTSATHHIIDDEGVADIRQGREEPRESHLTRFIHSSLILTPHAARIIGEWLIEKSNSAGEVKKQIEERRKKEETNHGHDGDTTGV